MLLIFQRFTSNWSRLTKHWSGTTLEPLWSLQRYKSYLTFVAMVSAMCKTTQLGREYTGTLSTTPSGRTCQRWDSQSPHDHNRDDPADFPENALPKNYCRNPDSESGGPWCYTTDPGVRYEYCTQIKYCNSCN